MSSHKPTLLYIPSYDYLSLPLYFSMADRLSGFRHVYFRTRDLGVDRTEQFDRAEAKTHFDELHIAPTAPWLKGKGGLLHLYLAYKHRKSFIQHFREQIEEIGPDLIIACTDQQYGVDLLDQYFPQIPLLILQPCLLSHPKRTFKLLPWLKQTIGRYLFNLSYKSFSAQYGLQNPRHLLGLWGRYWVESYHGRRGNLESVGSIIMENCAKTIGPAEKEAEKAALQTALAAPAEFPLVLLCLPHTMTRIYYEWFSSLIENSPEFFFIVRPHPRLRMDENIQSLEQSNSRITAQHSLEELYRVIDLNVSQYSNTAFESIVAGVPNVMFEENPKDFQREIFGMEIGLEAQSGEELIAAVRQALSPDYGPIFQEKRKAYLEYMVNGPEGSLERLEKLIYRLIEENPRP